jgi:vacuolar-type H+-ATPase subunit E/Vma4
MIDTLLATLEREAEAEIARVMDDARARVAALNAASDDRIAVERGALLGVREAKARAELERALAAARVAARGRVLAARTALLSRVFQKLEEQLPRVAESAEYRARLAAQIEQLMPFAGGQPVTVRCSPDLAPALRAAVKTNGRSRIQPDAGIAAGFRLTTGDGVLEIDATLEGRLERLRPELALEALGALAP